MAQFRQNKETGEWFILATPAEPLEAKDNGGIVSVSTKSGKTTLRHVVRWSKPFAFKGEETLYCSGYTCDTKREEGAYRQDSSQNQPQATNYADEPF